MGENNKSCLISFGVLLGAFCVYSGMQFQFDSVPEGFMFVWPWLYFLAADCALFQKTGVSMVVVRFADFSWLVASSLLIVAIFEIVNWDIGAWRYVNLSRFMVARGSDLLLYWASFIPFLAITSELLSAFDFPRKFRLMRIPITLSLQRILVSAGAVTCVYGLVWGKSICMVAIGSFFVLEVLNYRAGVASLIREISWGNWIRTVRLLFAGLIWGWGQFMVSKLASAKLLPGTEGLRHSPLISSTFGVYFMFASLALAGYSVYNSWSLLCGAKTWEKDVWWCSKDLLSDEQKKIVALSGVLIVFVALGLTI